ncbi:MAG TPA: GUN4 domain-containing protein [Thermosynechococcaceae cyanobacterium]
MDDCANLEKTLAIAKQTLARLEQQKAGHTFLSMPPNLEVDLEEKRKEVAELESRLAKATVQSEKKEAQQAAQAGMNRQSSMRSRVPSEYYSVDYTALRDVLKAGQWWEANIRTKKMMLKIAKREENRWLSDSSIENFPCIDLKTIDQLWMSYSKGRFGFSVQKQIWQECGSPRDSNENWDKFGDRVGWRAEGEWISEGNETFEISAPEGHLPFCPVWGLYTSLELGFGVILSISSRLVICDIDYV